MKPPFGSMKVIQSPSAQADMVAFGIEVVVEEFGAQAWQDMVHPIMAAEDFSYLLERVPGAYFFLGVSDEGEDWDTCCPLHSSGMRLK